MWRWWLISLDCSSGCWCVCPATAVSPVSSDDRYRSCSAAGGAQPTRA
jgi:hypothetical protein